MGFLKMAQTKYEIFLKVVEMGSLTRAAELFGYTQSAVSHAIHALESETGLRLIHRSRTGVRLTPEGEKLMPAFRRIAEAMQNYADTLEKVQGLEKGCVRIGAFNSVAVRWLPRMIKEYQQIFWQPFPSRRKPTLLVSSAAPTAPQRSLSPGKPVWIPLC